MSVNNPRILRWVATALLIGAVVLFAATAKNYTDRQLQYQINEVHERLNHAANSLGLLISGRFTALRVLASDTDLLTDDVGIVSDHLRRSAGVLNSFNLVLYNPDGTSRANAMGISGIIAGDHESFAMARKGFPILSRFFVSPEYPFPYASLRVPVRDDSGEVVTVLAGGLSLSEVEERLADEYFRGKETILIVDQKGQVIYPNLAVTASEGTSAVSGVPAEFLSGVGSGRYLKGSWIDLNSLLYLREPIENSPWHLLLCVPLWLLYATVLDNSVYAILIFLLSILCFVFLLYFYFLARLHRQDAAAARLEHLDSVSQLAAGISHEIRNPLTAIKGFLQLACRRLDDASTKEFLAVALEEVDRLEGLLNEFQMLAKPEQHADFETVELAEAADGVLRLMTPQAQGKNLSICQHLLPGCQVMGDRSQVRQVMINLLRNAIEAAPMGSEITVTTDKDREFAVFQVTDTGPGIPANVRRNLGKPFFTTKKLGTGMGLSVCFSIIKNHNGVIVVESEPGKGATFTVRLPLTVTESQT